jgi:hypothetical protein
MCTVQKSILGACHVQACAFRQDYVVESIGREFGTVMVDLSPGHTVNVALEAVRAGWAKVCSL